MYYASIEGLREQGLDKLNEKLTDLQKKRLAAFKTGNHQAIGQLDGAIAQLVEIILEQQMMDDMQKLEDEGIDVFEPTILTRD